MKQELAKIILACGCTFPEGVTKEEDEKVIHCADPRYLNRYQAKLHRDSWNVYKKKVKI